jgi:hypothetical protein
VHPWTANRQHSLDTALCTLSGTLPPHLSQCCAHLNGASPAFSWGSVVHPCSVTSSSLTWHTVTPLNGTSLAFTWHDSYIRTDSINNSAGIMRGIYKHHTSWARPCWSIISSRLAAFQNSALTPRCPVLRHNALLLTTEVQRLIFAQSPSVLRNSAHCPTLYIHVTYPSNNKQPLFPYAALTGKSL